MPDTALSYTCGPKDVPLMEKTIDQALDDAVAAYADREALVSCHQGIRWTYSELRAEVDKLATGLVALGLEKGERVGIWSPNNAEWVVTQLATAKAGLILVAINPAYRLSELEYALNKVQCRAIILADKFKTSNYIEMIQSLAPEISACKPGKLKSTRLPHLELAVVIADETPAGFMAYKSIAGKATGEASARLAALQPELAPEDPINIQFTSGTTGLPKGATLSHRNILNNGRNIVARQNFTCEDRLCMPVPMYHCFGIVAGVLGCISQGAAMILPGEAFEPESVLRAVEAERCTALYGVPTMFIAQLGLPNFGDFDLSSLRTGIMAGSPCPIETMKQVIDVMHMDGITIAYGMTETGPVSMQTTPDDTLAKRVSTVGRAHAHVEVKIIDLEGHIVPQGTQGELCSRGYSIMLGYWDDEERTAEAIDDEVWMHTGDLATMDEDGYANITGRLKDMIIRGGENVYPREIEEFFYRNPKIQDVQVFGVPDDKFGEEICAWIVLKAGENASAEEIKAFCQGEIAHYKVPRYVRFVEELPLTVTGKIQKFVMRERMIEELGLSLAECA
jgi:fatty-acyl-CoA synthase